MSRPNAHTRHAKQDPSSNDIRDVGLGGWRMHALVVALIMAMGAVGCGEDAVDEGPQDIDEAQLSLQAVSSFGNENGRVETDDSIGTLYTWTSARLVIEQIRLDLPADVPCSRVEDKISERVSCASAASGGDELQIGGPIVFDLITGERTPSLQELRIPSVAYENLEVAINVLDPSEVLDSDNSLANRAFLGSADFEYENQKRELRLEMGFEAQATALQGERMSLRAGDTLVLQFNASGWLDNIPVNECLQAGWLKAQDDLVFVNDDSGGECDDATLQFRQNFEDSLGFTIESADEAQ